MLWIINKIQENFKIKVKLKFLSLSELLNKHAKLENEFLYPKFKEELSEKDKQFIIEREEKIMGE